MDFLRHLFAFLTITSILFLVDWRRDGVDWVQWVALVWGIVLLWDFEQFLERALRRRTL